MSIAIPSIKRKNFIAIPCKTISTSIKYFKSWHVENVSTFEILFQNAERTLSTRLYIFRRYLTVSTQTRRPIYIFSYLHLYFLFTHCPLHSFLPHQPPLALPLLSSLNFILFLLFFLFHIRPFTHRPASTGFLFSFFPRESTLSPSSLHFHPSLNTHFSFFHATFSLFHRTFLGYFSPLSNFPP